MITFFIWLLIMIFVFTSISKRSVPSKTRNIGNIFAYIITGIFLFIMIFPVIKSSIKYDESKEATPADGFVINKYTVKLDVKEDNKVDVEEDVTVNWTEYGHHGIYKFTPEWFKYTSKNGKTIRRKSELSNLRTEVPPYTYNPDFEYNYGYGVDYTTDESLVESYYNSSYNFTTDVVKDKPRIKIGSSMVTLGKGEKDYIIKYTYDMGSDPYDGYDEFIFHAYGDYWGTTINNPSIEVTMPKSIEGMTIHFFKDKYRKEDVTNKVSYTVTDNKLVASYNGNDLYKSLTVDIELPDNYFINGSNNYGNASLVCIILCLINLFMIFILWLFFGKDYHKKAEMVSYLPPRDLCAAELGYMASNGYSKKLVIATIIELASKGLISIREEKKKTYIKSLKPDEKNKSVTKKYDDLVESLSDYERIVLNEFIDETKEKELKEYKTLYTVFSKVEKALDKDLRWSINEKVGFVLKYLGLALTCISALLMFLAYSSFEDLPQKIYSMYYVGFISVFVMVFLCVIMTRRSHFGEDIKVEINGFKKFLVNVEKNKLEELVEEIPHYFFKILPYTYVLNISKKWIEKFNDISIPESDIPMRDFSLLDSMSSDIYVPAPSYGSSGGSGCSSCGGGCSSCGGGCSSCGGGGSW